MAPRYVLQIMQMMFALVRKLFADRADLAAENLALRQQLAILNRKSQRPRLNDIDRAFWAAMKDHFENWAGALVIVKPDTVIRWQKKRFRDFWRRKSIPGRPRIDRRHIEFIRRISGDHPDYGEDRPFTLRGCLADGLIDHPHTLPHCDFWSLPGPNTPRMDFCGGRGARR